jgi:hypothetical protein
MDAALLSVIVSFITAFTSIIFTILRIRQERQERRQEFQSKLGELEVKFLHERIAQRYKTYPQVFNVLGSVRDVPDPDGKHYESLLQNREQLRKIADRLLMYLYGDAGLVMGMSVRNALLNVWQACHYFQTDDVTLKQLIGYFFLARRWLRADLQILDIEEVKSELDEIKIRFDLDASDEKIKEKVS